MAELKRKVTLKRKTPIEDKKPIKKNKFLLPILVVLLLVILIGGYFLLPTTEIAETTPENGITAQSPDSVVPETEPVSDSVMAEPNKTTEEPANEIVTNKPAEPIKEKSKLPYQPNVAYKVYQFPFGAANYSQPNPELDKLVKNLSSSNPSVKIKIFAYTDRVGSPTFNQALSEKRAKAIYDFLVSKGIDKSRLSYQGKGISANYANDAENRRAEFVLAE
jgi:outer membrane protein OmpA-like peptidoglycan-associated protein